ncbi:MAG: hypothetical protein ABSC65_29285 [Acidobacteriaceae bacterium]
MPKNTVTDPITDQEMAFAHLILSGTMNDRQAAEAAGLNPDTAAYTKSKPRVRDYMIEHRAAVKEKLVDQEAAGLRKLNLGRDQVLARLWELANLSHELTRGSIAGQIKALTMIVAIEGLIPDRRSSPPETQPKAPPVQAEIYTSEWLRKPQQPAAGPQAASEDPGDTLTPSEAQPSAPQLPHPEHAPRPTPPIDPNHPSLAKPLTIPDGRMRVPDAHDGVNGAVPDTRQPFSIQRNPFRKRR